MRNILFFLYLISISAHGAFITSDQENITNIIIKSDAQLFSPSDASNDCSAAVQRITSILEKQNQIILNRKDKSECLPAEGKHKFQAIISILKK